MPDIKAPGSLLYPTMYAIIQIVVNVKFRLLSLGVFNLKILRLYLALWLHVKDVIVRLWHLKLNIQIFFYP